VADEAAHLWIVAKFVSTVAGDSDDALLYQAQHRQLQIKQLRWKAIKLGFRVVEAPAA
jgi:hypothetical protein